MNQFFVKAFPPRLSAIPIASYPILVRLFIIAAYTFKVGRDLRRVVFILIDFTLSPVQQIFKEKVFQFHPKKLNIDAWTIRKRVSPVV
jgi:hypothetical protein